MKCLVVVQCAQGQPVSGALAAVTAAQGLGPLVILACGSAATAAADGLARLSRVERVLVVDDADLPTAQTLAPALLALRTREGCTHIVAAASTWTKGVLPRAAALLDVMALTEVVRIIDERTYVRPVFAGSALMTLRLDDAVHVLTVRSSAFEAPSSGSGPGAPVERVAIAPSTERSPSVLERHQPVEHGTVDLIGARVVVSGGRGTGSTAGFERLRPLAGLLGAAVGASRAAVDAGFAAADVQVGQTGKSVAPELYIAMGISGAVQHWAGMKDSKVIVAVNKDPEAPIFQFADYGLVADLFEVLPTLQERLAALPPRA